MNSCEIRRQTKWPAAALLFSALLMLAAAPAAAQGWNERTILKFSDPVMVPGATLQPGAYEFRLVDPDSNQNIVRITTEDGSRVIATTAAVPIKRENATGDVVVKFNPTGAGNPPALKAWFYPGSLYGHQFVYPDAEARQIAERTRTVVLSKDQPGSDMQKGTLYVYDASGKRSAWRGDPAVDREWQDWQRARASLHADRTRGKEPDAAATMVGSAGQANRVALDDIEKKPNSYIGKTVSVDAEVQDVFGPRLFSIDEPNWGDLDGEILVHVPSFLAALVREGDRVTVTGEIKRFVRADFEREWGWFDEDRKLEVQLSSKPVLVATQLVGGNNNVSMVITATPAETTDASTRQDAPVGTTGASRSGGSTGASAGGPLNDIGMLNQRGEDLVGRVVEFRNVNVSGTAQKGGFYIRGPQGTNLFVLPSDLQQTAPSANASVSVKGVVLQMPRGMRDKLKGPGDMNEDVYVFATDVVNQR